MTKYIKYLDVEGDWCVVPEDGGKEYVESEGFTSDSKKARVWRPCDDDDMYMLDMIRKFGGNRDIDAYSMDMLDLGWVHNTEHEHYYIRDKHKIKRPR